MLQKLMAPLGKLTAPLGKLTGGNPLVPGIIACVALAVIVPPMLAGYWIFLVTAGLLTTITAMGLAIIVGWVGEVNLAGAGLLGASVYVTGYFYRVGDSRLNGWPFIPAALTGILFAAFLSGLVAIPTARFSGIYVMVLTLGLQITLERTLFSFPWIIGGFGRNVIVHRPRFLGVSFDSDLRFFYLCLAAAVGAGLFVNALRKSRHGRAMNLIRTDKRAPAASAATSSTSSRSRRRWRSSRRWASPSRSSPSSTSTSPAPPPRPPRPHLRRTPGQGRTARSSPTATRSSCGPGLPACGPER